MPLSSLHSSESAFHKSHTLGESTLGPKFQVYSDENQRPVHRISLRKLFYCTDRRMGGGKGTSYLLSIFSFHKIAVSPNRFLNTRKKTKNEFIRYVKFDLIQTQPFIIPRIIAILVSLFIRVGNFSTKIFIFRNSPGLSTPTDHLL